MSLWRSAGGEVLGSTLVLGLWQGVAISSLGGNRTGKKLLIIVCAATAGALAAAVYGVCAIDFQIEDWNRRLGKAAAGTVSLFWLAFCGGLLGAIFGALGCSAVRQAAEAERDDAQETPPAP